MPLESSLIFRHLPREFVHDHFDRPVKITGNGRGFELAAALYNLNIHNAFMSNHGNEKLDFHRLQLKFGDLFDSTPGVLHQCV